MYDCNFQLRNIYTTLMKLSFGGLIIVYITPDNNKHITGLHQHTPTKYKHNLPLAAEALLLHR